MLESWRWCGVALLVVALPWPVGAQWLSTESHAALTSELGLFTYDRDRYANDFEIGVHGAFGYRVQRRWLYVEPQLRAMVRVGGGYPDVFCEGEVCAAGREGAVDDTPLFWPGLGSGVVLGDEYFSQSLALRGAVGIGKTLNPLVGARYEGSARWFGWFAELNLERLRWTADEIADDAGNVVAWEPVSRWSPSLVVGGRLWMRRISAPRPAFPGDAGILSTTFEELYRHADTVAARRHEPEAYLAVWAEDEDRVDSPFLAIIDVDSSSATFGEVVSTLPIGEPGSNAHHTQLPAPRDGRLWVNSFNSGETFLLDVARPRAPSLVTRLDPAAGMTHPHSFAPLADGTMLVTYQLDEAGTGPGGVAVHAADGRFLRSGSAVDPASSAFVRPYSALALESFDRALTTGADMHGGAVSRAIQLWRLSDLRLLGTLGLPAGPAGTENADSFEPRMLPDGSVLVITLGCGLHHIAGIDSGRPHATLVHTFGDRRCFMPAVVGFWWLQALAGESAIEVLDVTDPRRPRVASRLELPQGWVPHWIAPDRNGDRIVVTGYSAMKRRVLMLRFDRRTGELQFAPHFGSGGAQVPGVSLDGPAWPHGETGPALPHGAVFLPDPPR